MIDKLGNVCDSCGRKIVPIETVDNSNNPTYWAGCKHGGESGNFTGGVPKGTYELAKKLVLNGDAYYSHLDKNDYKTKEQKQYWFESQVSGMARFIERMEYYKNNKARKTKAQFLKDF